MSPFPPHSLIGFDETLFDNIFTNSLAGKCLSCYYLMKQIKILVDAENKKLNTAYQKTTYSLPIYSQNLVKKNLTGFRNHKYLQLLIQNIFESFG